MPLPLRSFDIMAKTDSLTRIQAGEFSGIDSLDELGDEKAQAACLDLLAAISGRQLSSDDDSLIEETALLIAVIRDKKSMRPMRSILRQNLAKLGLTPDSPEDHQRRLLTRFKGKGSVN